VLDLRSLIPTAHTTAYISDSFRDALPLPALRVLPMLVPAIHNDITLLQVRHQAAYHGVAYTAMWQAEEEDLRLV